MMDTPAFAATRLVRPALLTVPLYFLAIMISSMTMFRHVHAEGIVASSGTVVYLFQMCNFNSPYYCVPIAGDIPTLPECQALASILPGFPSGPVQVYGGGC
jgi:hypothetical protein